MAQPASFCVHQIWFNFRDDRDETDQSIPAEERSYLQSIQQMCAAHGWTHRLWLGFQWVRDLRRQMEAEVLSGTIPWLPETPCAMLWELFDRLPLPVQKHDFLRWIVLYRYGGLYLDMDVYWQQGLRAPPVVQQAEALLVMEKKQHNTVANSFMLVRKPFSPFAASMIDGLLLRFAEVPKRQPISSMGPLGVRKVLEALPAETRSICTLLDGNAVDLVHSPRKPTGWTVHAYKGRWDIKGKSRR